MWCNFQLSSSSCWAASRKRGDGLKDFNCIHINSTYHTLTHYSNILSQLRLPNLRMLQRALNMIIHHGFHALQKARCDSICRNECRNRDPDISPRLLALAHNDWRMAVACKLSTDIRSVFVVVDSSEDRNPNYSTKSSAGDGDRGCSANKEGRDGETECYDGNNCRYRRSNAKECGECVGPRETVRGNETHET